MRLQFLRNKKTFSRRGVILECYDGAVRICHIPHCGMDSKTADYLGEWLHERAFDIKLKREPKTKEYRQRMRVQLGVPKK